MTVLITGAAGNLGSLLARHLIAGDHRLRLMYHRRPLPADIAAAPAVHSIQADLADPRTLLSAVQNVDVVVHFAGVLFAPRPERFLPETNTRWFSNLLDASLAANVGRVILISFPHVEGPTSVDQPATGRLDRHPISVHAQTRLEEERLLLERTVGTGTTPVVLRLGMIYGRGILMIDAARWLARRRLLAVWREPTLMQLLSIADYPAEFSGRGVPCLGLSIAHPCSHAADLCGGSGVRGVCADRTSSFAADPRFRSAGPCLSLGRYTPRPGRIDPRIAISNAENRAFNAVI